MIEKKTTVHWVSFIQDFFAWGGGGGGGGGECNYVDITSRDSHCREVIQPNENH